MHFALRAYPTYLAGVIKQENMARAVVQCSIPAALEAIGERWSFLILRGAFNGMRHFEQFQSTLGIARNILSDRLARLTSHGILERVPCAEDRRRVEYRLTEKGAALLPTLIALRQWGERWATGVPDNPVLVDAERGRPVRPVSVLAEDGRPLGLRELRWVDRSTLE